MSWSFLIVGHLSYFHFVTIINNAGKTTFVFMYHCPHNGLFPWERFQGLTLWRILLSLPWSQKIWNHGILAPGIWSYLLMKTETQSKKVTCPRSHLNSISWLLCFVSILCSLQDNAFFVDSRTSFLWLLLNLVPFHSNKVMHAHAITGTLPLYGVPNGEPTTAEF